VLVDNLCKTGALGQKICDHTRKRRCTSSILLLFKTTASTSECPQIFFGGTVAPLECDWLTRKSPKMLTSACLMNWWQNLCPIHCRHLCSSLVVACPPFSLRSWQCPSCLSPWVSRELAGSALFAHPNHGRCTMGAS